MSKKIKNKSMEKKAETQHKLMLGYLYHMSLAPKLDDSPHWFQLLPAAFFTAVIIMITRLHPYERPMDQFFWSDGGTQLTDFFSYYKMTAILLCAVFVLILLLYQVFSQSLSIRKSYAYIPMLVYIVFVSLSYFLSDYKLFALWGFNDRFEGTITLFGYMIMLFYIINVVRTERDTKWIIYPVAITSALLGLLGLTQALDHDFFRTTLGKKLITPSWFWNQLDTLNFTFQNKQIYQTVYNINYVSFYLTLLIPLFGMIFIRSFMMGKDEPVWKKVIWGLLFTLLVYNLIGSASSGGLLGMAVVVLIGILVLNKRIIKWIKPVLVLLIISAIITGITYDRWLPELTNAVDGVINKSAPVQSGGKNAGTESNTSAHQKIDYIITSGNAISMSIEGNEINFVTLPKSPQSLQIKDSKGTILVADPTNTSPVYRINDKRFERITVRLAQDEDRNSYYVIATDGKEWPFELTDSGPKFLNGFGKLVDLHMVPSMGWQNNQSFGSGRGYIWSRSIPMVKNSLFIGRGADTYCLYFPHEDYVGKYNADWNINMVVDKPHCMYLGLAINTGLISLLALLALWGIYIVQSIRLYFRRDFDSDFITFAGSGISFGVCGFLTAALVNDSSVSVMPLFYGLLGTGIAINMILKKRAL